MPSIPFHPADLFQIDRLSFVLAGLILFVIANVTAYSARYLAGDRNYRAHRWQVLLLAASVLLMAISDNLWLFLAAWGAGNFLLVKLMIHKSDWEAALNSGRLAFRTFVLGFVLLAAGFWLLSQSTNSASISEINRTTGVDSPQHFVGLLLIAVAALTQSAAWPFHRWLTSSLNSPTPVSALMHAGLVNGGGFLLARFAPLYASEPLLLHGLFVAGLITAIVGTFWKLVQTDIKRMLACSTMGQMGFMLMQVGMGLFAPAISHLCWHGLFKAYLFLSAGSVVKEKRRVVVNTLSPLRILVACLAGGCGAVTFALTSGTHLSVTSTEAVIVALAFMCATQLAAGLLEKPLTALRMAGAVIVGSGSGALYGLSIRLIESAVPSLHATRPLPMDAVYVTGLAAILLMWIAMYFNLPVRLQSFNAWKWLYMAALNGSQPQSRTVTANRTAYQS